MKKNYITLAILALLLQTSLQLQAQTFYVTDKVLVGVYEQSNTESNLIKALPTGTPIEVLEKTGEFTKVRSPDGTTGWVETSYLIDHKPAQLVVLELTDQQKQANEQLSLAQAELEATQKQLADLRAGATKDTSTQEKKLTDDLKKSKKKSKALKKDLAASKKQLENKSRQHDSIEKQNKELQKEIINLRKNKPVADKAAPAPVATVDDAKLRNIQAQNKQLSATLNQIRETLQLPANSTSIDEAAGVTLKYLWLFIGALILAMSGFIGGIKWLDWRNLKRHGGFRI
ncbi:MAG: TIGR04211 family SH3 domain-containing protein [Sulfuriflexus sp.]|nr:TIGR04211 family SH3 domain-containing protein [Sulfuriflexus sp.]